VLGLGAVASKDLDAWQVYGGVPARQIRERARNNRRGNSRSTSV